MDEHLSRRRVTTALQRSTRDCRETSRLSPARWLDLSLLDLAPNGGCLAARITTNAGGLLRHLFTLTPIQERYVSVALSSRFPRSGISPAFCPMECGLSSVGPLPGRAHPTNLGVTLYLTVCYLSIDYAAC